MTPLPNPLPRRILDAVARLATGRRPPMLMDPASRASLEQHVSPGMKIRIVNDDDDGWVLGKIARNLHRELQTMGMDVSLGKESDSSAEINHHIIYYGYVDRVPTVETVMITHIDDERELSRVRRQLIDCGVEMAICMSFEAVHRLAHFGVPREKLCFISPAHDGTMKPRKALVGLTARLYSDGRKREHLLEELAESISVEDFRFTIMGSGWELIVQRMRNKGFEVDYLDHFDEPTYRKLMPGLDYYLYLGQDEGSIGFIDALAAGIATIVTPQGFHLDVPGGITHAFENLHDLRKVFAEIAGLKRRRIESVSSLTWPEYARKHLLVWEYLLCRKNGREIPSAMTEQLEGLGLLMLSGTDDPLRNKGQARVFYGFPSNAFEDDRIRGGEAKLHRLRRFFPDSPNDFNVVYLNGSSLPPTWQGLFWRARQSRASVVWNQDGVGYKGWHGPGWEDHNVPLALGNELADHVFYQSRFSKKSADLFLGPRERPWEILYNAVDTRHFSPRPQQPDKKEIVLLLGGNQHQFYRIESAVYTLMWLRRSLQNVRLLVTGELSFTADPAEARRLFAALLARSGAVDFVRWIGPYGQRDAPEIFSLADLLLHTKVKDPCPSVVIEALACGLPVVYADSGGVPELVGEDAGVGVATPDGWDADIPPAPEEFGRAVIEALETRGGRREAARGRAVEHFDIQPWIRRHREVFETLRQPGRSRPGSVRPQEPSLRLVRLIPERTASGRTFNVQPNGESALVVDSANASPATCIVFDGTPLKTDYGGPNMLSAFVPAALIRPGRLIVHLLNGLATSNSLEFVVDPEETGHS